ncbi:UNVERIFIED_CONTAM: Aquaporin-9 [Trichonephila clavipes]
MNIFVSMFSKVFKPENYLFFQIIFIAVIILTSSVNVCFIFSQLVVGFLLMFTVMAIVDSKNLNIPKYLWPVFIGFMIQVTAQTFGMNCMAPINPARDFPTRVFTAIAGWGGETFGYVKMVN